MFNFLPILGLVRELAAHKQAPHSGTAPQPPAAVTTASGSTVSPTTTTAVAHAALQAEPILLQLLETVLADPQALSALQSVLSPPAPTATPAAPAQ